jgi:tetratricopeptide (TPR) repeat protein
VIWAIEPQWLKDVSQHGKIVESSENKQKGDELLRQQNYQEALAAYSRALEVLPEMQSARIGSAIALQKLGKTSDAVKIYRELLKEDLDKPWEVYFNLAALYEQQRDKEKTIEALQKAIDTAPDPFDGYVRLARLHFTSSEWKTALRYYNQAFEHKPDIKNDYMATLRSEMVTYSKEEDLKEVIADFIKKGFGESEENKYYAEPYSQQLKENPLIAMIYNDAGFCYAMLGDIASSLPFFRSAVKLQPDNQEYQQNLAKAQHELEKLEE